MPKVSEVSSYVAVVVEPERPKLVGFGGSRADALTDLAARLEEADELFIGPIKVRVWWENGRDE